MDIESKHTLKLYMLLLGSKAPGRHVEQHDFFFGIAHSMKELVPEIKKFWSEAGEKIHIDAWREINIVDGYRISIKPREGKGNVDQQKLFFINLGGYQENKFEEQHYVVLTVKPNRAAAFSEAKETLFFKNNHFEGARTHIDDKYGIDVDDLYEIDEILLPVYTEKYQIALTEEPEAAADKIHLGYLKLANV